MKRFDYKKIEAYLPYGFILLGFIMTLSTITIQPLWFDEHLTMNETQAGSLKNMMTLVLRHESIPPLFFIIEYFLIKLFSLSAFSLRIIPALAGTLGAFFYWKIFLKAADRTSALLSLILCLSSSFLLAYAQEARPYSILFCESMILLYFSIRWLEKHDIGSAAAVAVSMFAAMNTHYYALFMNIAVILSLFIAEKKRMNYSKSFIVFTTAAFLSVVSVAPWIIKQLALQVNGQKTFLISKAGFAIPFIPVSTLSGSALTKITILKDLEGWNTIILLLMLLIFGLTTHAIFCCLRKILVSKKIHGTRLFLTLFFIIAFAQHIVTGFHIPSLHPRYTIYSMMLLFGGILTFTAPAKLTRNFLFVTLLGINIFGLFRYWDQNVTFRVPWNRIASDIDAQSPETAVVASSESMHVFSLPFYMKSNTRIALLDPNVFLTSNAPLFKRIPYSFFNRDLEIYQHTFEYYNSDKNKPDTPVLTFLDFVKLNPSGLFLYQEDGMPYNKSFLKHSIPDLKVKIVHHYETNQGILYIIRWEFPS